VTTTHPGGGVNSANWLRGDPPQFQKEYRMADVKRKEQISRQQAAERLTDVAYALTAGGRLKLDADEDVTVPVADQVILKRESKSNGDWVEIDLVLSWSTRGD
jgi:amphi-Trp domain-containing protein